MDHSSVKKQFDDAVLLDAKGQFSDAISVLDNILITHPDHHQAWHLHGMAWAKQGQFENAMTSFQKAIAANPDYADAFYAKGVVHHMTAQEDQAITCFKKALSLQPVFPKASNNLGIAYTSNGQAQEALSCFDAAIDADPTFTQAYYGKAYALDLLGQTQDALIFYARALDLDPEYADAWNGKGKTLIAQDRFEEAITALNQAIKIQPKHAMALSNRSSAYTALGHYDQALEDINISLSLAPDNAHSIYNKAIILSYCGDADGAIAAYNKSLMIRPDHIETIWNKSLLDLLNGDWEKGWAGYQSRLKREGLSDQHLLHPQLNIMGQAWDGQHDLMGKTIFIQCEQGFGDSIQFCRYLKSIDQMGAKIILAAQAPLIPVLKTLDIPITVIALGQMPDHFDYYCPLMSLPFALKARVENTQPEASYLSFDPEKADLFTDKINPKELKIGLVCSGRPTHKNDHNRSLSLDLLSPLLSADCDFHMLQKDYRDEDQALLNALPHVTDHHDMLNDFADTAGLISHMDVVISVDTSIAHLAGALGKPVWVMLPFMPDFRWLLGREDTVWYQSARLFRQSEIGQWSDVIDRLHHALQDRIKTHS